MCSLADETCSLDRQADGCTHAMLFLRLIKQLGHTTQAEQITLSAKACDDPISSFGDKRVVTEFLAFVHDGNMHLDHRPLERIQSIQDGDRRMGGGIHKTVTRGRGELGEDGASRAGADQGRISPSLRSRVRSLGRS
jgi:hypothetical protein